MMTWLQWKSWSMKLISMSRSLWIILEICKTLKKLLSWWIRWFYVGFIPISGLANVIPNRLYVTCILLPLISVEILNTFGWSSAVLSTCSFLKSSAQMLSSQSCGLLPWPGLLYTPALRYKTVLSISVIWRNVWEECASLARSIPAQMWETKTREF